MIDESARPQRAGSMAWQTIDGETVLLNIDARELLGVNDVASRVWVLCDGTHTVGEIAATVAAEFEVDQPTALADVRAFLDELTKTGAIELG
jgi:hypothetical protein